MMATWLAVSAGLILVLPILGVPAFVYSLVLCEQLAGSAK